MRAAAVYIHVPFCLRKCPYCDFYSVVPRDGWIERYQHALQKELELRLEQVEEPIRSVYFGGGTPSLLDPGYVERVLQRLGSLASDCEVTLECNPSANIRVEFFASLRAAGVNRLSIGVQSFHDLHLKMLGRLHDASEARWAIRAARRAGFENIGIDLIYGIPNQRMSEWVRDLRTAIEEGACHISTYELTVEDGTPLDTWIKKGQVRLPDPDRTVEFYLRAHEFLSQAGFEHYEVSNYSLPGFRCRHNERYWQRMPYLGFGPSAHSFLDSCRLWNARDLHRYCRQLEEGHFPIEGSEELSNEQELTERVFLSLRTDDGLDLRTLGLSPELALRVRAWAKEVGDYLQVDEFRIRPTVQGMLVAEDLAVRLLRYLQDSWAETGSNGR
ncbi:MAG: radical SAM family heme chaperone HemW [candidate division KSB1 bacterium]|nr:radical SAM family heme chaperone HemW [candidate division KSB1 bacterium]